MRTPEEDDLEKPPTWAGRQFADHMEFIYRILLCLTLPLHSALPPDASKDICWSVQRDLKARLWRDIREEKKKKKKAMPNWAPCFISGTLQWLTGVSDKVSTEFSCIINYSFCTNVLKGCIHSEATHNDPSDSDDQLGHCCRSANSIRLFSVDAF